MNPFLKPILFLCSTIALALPASAQNLKNKSVKTTYFNYPTLPITGVSTYQIEISKGPLNVSERDLVLPKKDFKNQETAVEKGNYFAYQAPDYQLTSANPDVKIAVIFGAFTITDKQMLDHDVPCTRKGEKATVDNLKTCPAYYYNLKYTLPCLIKFTNKEGQILYMEELGGGHQVDSILFGYKRNSGYLYSKDLKAAYEEKSASIVKEAFQLRLQAASLAANAALYFSEVQENVKVMTGKGKQDYSDLNTALETAIKGYEAYAKNSLSSEAGEKLRQAIAIWEKALTESNIGDKKARINGKVSYGLQANLATAYLYTGQLDKAVEMAGKAVKMANSMSSINRRNQAAAQLQLISTRKIGAKVNAAASTQKTRQAGSLLFAPAFQSKKASNLIFLTGKESMPANLKAYQQYQVEAFGIQPMKGAEGLSNADLNDIVSGKGVSGGYAERVVKSSSQGYSLTLNGFLDKFEVLPEEICQISHLNQLYASGLKMTVLPASIGQLENLKVLNLANNQLKVLPAEIGQLTQLRKLNLKSNNLTSLPPELSGLKELKTLILTGNSIPPAEIARLQKQLPNCKIKS